MALWLEHHQVRQILRAAQTGLPDETCGLLGCVGGRVERVIQIDNVAANPERRYEMDPRQLTSALFDFERAGLEVGAIWHSHPRGLPVPSAEDIRAAAWPDACHVIVCLADGEAQLAAWRIVNGEVTRAPLRIGAGAPDVAPYAEQPGHEVATWTSAALAVILALLLALSLLPPAPRLP